jgi:two-component SAPR family response regulator
VVDDDLGLQDLFWTFLKEIGFSRMGIAKEAIESLRKQKFDLMFLDLQLPDAPVIRFIKQPSTDSIESHQEFIKKHGLPFPLLSDSDQEIVKAYQVWAEKALLS